MTREEAKQLLAIRPVLEAFAERKPIQFRVNDGQWFDLTDLVQADFFYPSTEWRVKPEPREFWIACGRAFSNRMIALSCNHSSEEIVHVREIL